MLTVVAALIECEGKILVCQRRRGGDLGLMWEFPGGKKESAETPEEALARELREELGVAATIGAEVYRTRHQYAAMSEPIELLFLAASAEPAHMQNRVFEQIQWRSPHSLVELNFLPADRELIERLADGTLCLGGLNAPTG
ncbi:MAG: NUDIX domain-containing protein [Candidatus Acidiferrales bacterium]